MTEVLTVVGASLLAAVTTLGGILLKERLQKDREKDLILSTTLVNLQKLLVAEQKRLEERIKQADRDAEAFRRMRKRLDED